MNAPFLATIRAFLVSKVALRRVFGTLAARASAQINVKELPLFLVIVAIGTTVLAKDMVDRLPHLFNVCVGAGVEGILHDRLLRAPGDAERLTQGRVGTQFGVDLDHAMRSGQEQYKGISQFVKGRVFDSLLCDPHLLLYGSEQIHVMQVMADSRQTGVSTIAGV
jgi:hypothetical protein